MIFTIFYIPKDFIYHPKWTILVSLVKVVVENVFQEWRFLNYTCSRELKAGTWKMSQKEKHWSKSWNVGFRVGFWEGI